MAAAKEFSHMRHDRILSGSLWAVLAIGAIGSTGCTHNYYYTSPAGSPCAPVTLAPATPVASNVVQYGEICEVPTRVVGGSTVVAGVPVISPPVLAGPRPPRIVLSEPGGSRVRTPWRRQDPESSLATTRVEGAVDDDTTLR
jgi:hypothetical protein